MKLKSRVACYMTAATNEWIRAAWRNESQKEQISLVEGTISFDEGSVIIGKETLNSTKDRKNRKRSRNTQAV